MANTPNLALPYIDQNQSQKHVTHNVAIRELDAIVQLSVLNDALTAPPATPSDGDRYIVATGGVATWLGKDGKVAAWQDGAWNFYAPRPGWLAFIASRSAAYLWTGAAWIPLASAIGALANLAGIGILTVADSNNRLAVKSDAALFSHDDVTPGSGDVRIAVNKSATVKDAGFTFQDAFSTRALFGLLGDDDFRIKVSADGSTFYEALQVDRNTGEVLMRQRRLQAALAAHGGKTEIFCDEQLVTLSGPTTSSTVVIPNGAIVLAVSNRVVTAITGTTSYSCGVSGEAGKFGSSLGIAAGSTNRGVIGPTAFYADTAVLFTAAGGAFTGGQVRMTLHYILPTWATS